MLSILIPTFNFNITKLVGELHHQAIENFVEFEIIVIEDGSNKFLAENKSISHLANCIYIVLEKNIGRSAIRNKLADTAKYNHLLFLDCDAALPSVFFVQKYLTFCHDECVVLGGRIYDEKNTDPQYSLIRKYGKIRERNDIHNLNHRLKKPMFTTPNFLISKPIFNKIRFDETIIGYGHEDTIFGIKLHELNIDFIFIDNPVIHVGLDNNEDFYQKTAYAVSNLYQLYESKRFPTIQNESKLLATFIKAKKYHLTFALSLIYTISSGFIHKQLCKSNPSLVLYDIYKLLFMCKTAHKK